MGSWYAPVPAPYFRKSFSLAALPERACLSVCGLGFYRVFLNGHDITKGHLAPYIANSAQLVPYDEYENVLPYLKKGKNTVAFHLGCGMQNCYGGFVWDFDKATFRSAPKLAFALSLETGERVETLEATDVVCKDSPVRFDDLRIGEIYDARYETPDWALPELDDGDWSPVIHVEPPTGEPLTVSVHPITCRKILAPVRIFKEEDGYVYDFGENTAGLTHLRVTGEAGQRIVILHGEKLKDGRFTQENIRFYNEELEKTYPFDVTQRTEYILRGEGTEEHRPHFTYYAFRYAKVIGITEAQATKDLLTYEVMNTAFSDRGDFSCSDATVTKLQEMTRRSTLSNFWHFPNDCPHREKNGWTADAALSAEQTLLNFDPEDNYVEWIRSICRAMRFDGALPGIVPTGGWGFAWGNGPAWDAVLVYLPYFNYRFRDDLRAAHEASGSFLRYIHYQKGRRNAQGLLEIGLGDWVPAAETAPLVFTDSVMALDIATKMTVLFRAMEMDAEAVYTDAFAREMRQAIRTHLFDAQTGAFSNGTQCAQAMALFYGLCDSEEECERAVTRLLDAITAADDHMTGGCLCGRVIFRVLADYGKIELALKLITRPDAPSYGVMIEKGYDTLWENLAHDLASCNHHFWGDISAFFIEYLAGIRLNPHLGGADTLAIAPLFPASLAHAEGYHVAPLGKIASAWRREGDGILLTLTVPEGMSGNILLPEGYAFANGARVLPAKSGSYIVQKQ